MKSKLDIAEKPPIKPEYPKLMQHSESGNRTVVLFTTQKEGVCVFTDAPNIYQSVGKSRNDWCHYNFQPYYGSVTISSED